MLRLDRLSEFQKVKSGIVAGGHLEKGRNRTQGFPESRVICGLEIPRGYGIGKGGAGYGGCYFSGRIVQKI